MSAGVDLMDAIDECARQYKGNLLDEKELCDIVNFLLLRMNIEQYSQPGEKCALTYTKRKKSNP